MLRKEDIHAFLDETGAKKDGTILVHTSMRAIGDVENGCDGLIDGFCSYLTEGLFLVPTHTWSNVNRTNPVYDVRKTVPCIGALPTVAAFRKDGVRSLHPTHSMAAFGKRAREYVACEKLAETPCSPTGAWGKLLDEHATVLLIGVGLKRYTFLHAVDEMLDLPGRLSEPFTVSVTDENGVETKRSLRHHTPKTGSANFDNYRKPFEVLGAVRHAKLGNAEVLVCDTVKTAEAMRVLWSRADYHLCEEPGEIPEKYYI